jgi:hypothetical protein
LDVWTAELIGIFSSIGLTGFFRNTVLFSENIDLSRVTAVAGSSGLAVHDDLGWEIHVRPGSVSNNIDSVGDGAGCSVGPAASAVNWYVLVSGPWKPVSFVDVSPVPFFGKVLDVEVFVRSGWNNVFFHSLGGDSLAFIVVLSGQI